MGARTMLAMVSLPMDVPIYLSWGQYKCIKLGIANIWVNYNDLACLLYPSDAADDLTRVDLGGRRII
jgi:hypothetical protein